MNNKPIGKLDETTTALFICDIQEYYINKVTNLNVILENNKCLSDASKLLNIPIIMTKHDPSYYGEIIEYLNPNDEYKKVYSKSLYSMYNDDVKEYINGFSYRGLKSIILTGLESFVCILQTALDLIEDGYEVHVVVDATDSINKEEHKNCLKRLKQSGVFLISTEAVLFQLIKDDKHNKSKEVIELITNRNYDNKKY